jgi:hypothetical protein
MSALSRGDSKSRVGELFAVQLRTLGQEVEVGASEKPGEAGTHRGTEAGPPFAAQLVCKVSLVSLVSLFAVVLG